MKKLLFAFCFVFVSLFTFSQTIVFQEGFETLPLSVVSTGNPGWARSNVYAKTGVYSDSSRVAQADSTFLTTYSFSTTGNSYVILEFAQICKVEFFDEATIEVSINGGTSWTKLTGAEYLGNGQFATSGNKFTAVSYPIWDPNNPATIPQNAWWQTETFDISNIAANQADVMVRFRLRDGNNNGHNGNYGWLLDDIKVTVAPSELIPPVITLQTPIFQDTIHTTNPYEIKALISDVSGIDTAYVTYSINSGTAVNIGMTHLGNNIYSAFIPSQSYNTHVDYQVFAIDSSPASNLGQSSSKWFYVKKGPDIVNIGTGTTTNSTFEHPVPYGTYYKNHRVQYMILASELTALGISAGQLASIGFNVAALNTLADMPNYTIKMKHTTATSLTSTFETGVYTTVWTDANFMPVVGWNTHTFTTPFNWDGTSNIIVDLCFDIIPGTYTENASMYYTATTANLASYFRSDYDVACGTTSLATVSLNRANMQIGVPPNNNDHDAGISQILSPTGTVLSGTPQDVSVRVKNYGVQALTNAQIGWSVNGLSQTPFAWTGNLTQDQVSNPVIIGQYTFTAGPYNIKAWTFDPNGQTDEKFSNDTAGVSVYSCDAILNGAYTVGGVGADYPTLNDALTALELCGISGPVVMNINAGTFNERIVIPVIPGISAINTVTFKGQGAATVINYNTNNTNERAAIVMDNKKFITFDSLSVEIPDTSSFGWGFFITNQSENIEIKNCFIKTSLTSTSTNHCGIVISGSYTGATSTGNTIKNLLLSNNTVEGGYYGISIIGESLNKTREIILNQNVIKNVYYSGLYMSQSVAPVITKNSIETRISGNSFSTSSSGIYILNIDSATAITKNRIKNIGLYGMYLTSCNSTADPILIANNMIGGGFSNTGTPYGIYISSSSNIDIYHNSINVNAGTGRPIYLLSTVSQAKVLNNSFAYTGTGNSYAAYYASTASLAAHDYNNYYVNNSNTFVYYGAAVANLIDLQAVNLPADNDLNSKVGNPNYSTPVLLYPSGTQLWNSGTPIATVTDDIDGLPRSATTPCIGAVEYAPPADDAALMSVISPLNSACNLSNTEDITLLIKNFGTATMTSVNATYQINNNVPVTQTFAVNIPMDSVQEITFSVQADLSAYGVYIFNFWVDKTGDINALNDSILNYKLYHSHDFYAGAYTMSFEPTEYFADWSIQNPGGGTTTWVVPLNNNTFANTGSNSAQFLNGTANTGDDWLFSRCFNLVAGTTYEISFYYRNGSTTVGNNIELKMGDSLDPANMTTSLINLPGIVNTTYLKASESFVAPATGVYYFGWRAYSSPSSTYAYIDDINLKVVPPVEASVISIPKPVSACGLAMDTITIVIKNSGADTLNTNLTAKYQVDGGTIISETVTLNSLPPDQTFDYTFATLFDFSSVGVNTIFNLKTWIELTGDPLQFNDSLIKQVVSSYLPANPVTSNATAVYGTQATLNAISVDSIFWFNNPVGGNILATGNTFVTPPLFNTTIYYAQAITPGGTTNWTFDNDLEGWTVQNPCNSSFNWAWNADNGDGALFAVNPTATSSQLITSPVTIIAGSSSVNLSFKHRYATESGWDEGYVAYRLDNGPWIQFIPTVNGYNVTSQNIDSDPLNNCVSNSKPCYSGSQTTPIISSGTINTAGASNIQLAFVFTSDGSGAVIGWYINEVTLGGSPGGCPSDRIPDTAFVTIPDYEAQLIDITSPVDGNCSYNTEQITIIIKNNGLQEISNGLTAYYQVNNGAITSENVTTAIPSNDSIVFTFATPLSITITGADTTIEVKTYVNHAGDPYQGNDTLSKQITLLFTPDPPVATSPVTVPYGTSATITATSPQQMKWFDMLVGGTQIGSGPSYITPVLYDTTTYYVEANNTLLGQQTTVGIGTATTYQMPTNGLWDYSWTASIYKASELNFSGIIDTLMWDVSNSITSPFPMLNQKIYLTHTTDSIITSTSKPDPSLMTEVFVNTISWIGPGWFKIPLQTIFNYDGTSNLMIYWENHDGAWTSGYPNFNYTTTTTNTGVYAYDDGAFPATTIGTITNTRPNVRFSHSVLGCPSSRTPVQVNVSGVPADDAGIVSVDAPASPTNFGSQDIEVTLHNYGSANLTNVTINWEVNGLPQTAFTWTGNLPNAQSESNIVIGQYNFTLGFHDFKVWTTNPNGNADIYNLNDTAYATIESFEPLNGIYTIGGVNPDYATFTDARNALIHYGVSGPVTFKARSGIYTEKMFLPAYTGASATNTVTFMPDTNANVTLTAADTFVVKIMNASYYIFDGSNNGTNSQNFNIINTSTNSNTAAIWLAGGNNYITIENCKIAAGSNTITSTFAVHIGGANITTSGTGNNNDITIKNNTITKTYYGIYARALAASKNNNLLISGNTIGSTTPIEYVIYRGIDIVGAITPVVEKNEIFNLQTTSSLNVSGIDIGAEVTNAKVSKNIIRGLRSSSTGGWGAYGINISSGTGTTDIEISNNFISDILTINYGTGTTYNPFGIRITGGTGHKIWYNSVNMFGHTSIGTSTSMSACFITTAAITGLDIRNNIFANSITGNANSKSYTTYVTSGTTFTRIDYNNYYPSGTYGILGYSGATDILNLNAWKLFTLKDTNSLSVNPGFISPNNLHTFSVSVNGKGTPIAQITEDIDGDLRDLVSPDMGADEFDPLDDDLGVIAIVSPSNNCGLSNSQVIAVEVKNNGQNAITSFSISYTINGGSPVSETFTGSLATDSLHTFTFATPANMGGIMSYTIFIQTTLTGDQYTQNDTLTLHLPAIHDFANAYFMGFEANENHQSWTSLNVLNDASRWVIPYTSTSFAYAGSNSAQYLNSSTNPSNDWMFSPCFTLLAGETYKLEFYYRAESVNYPQNLTVLMGSDKTPIGMTDTLVVLSGFTNTTYQKASAIFNVAATGTYYFGWFAHSVGSAYDHFVDNINIRLLPPKDAGVTELVNITPIMNGGDVVNIEAQIKNFGADTLFSIPIKYSVNGGAVVTETWMGTLIPDSTVVHTFATALTIPANQFNLCTWTQLSQDGNTGNDTLCINAFGIPLVTIPFTDDYEGPAFFYIEGLNNQWQHGEPNASVVNTAHSPVNVWATNLTGNYANSSNYNLYSPRVSFIGIVNAQIGFWHWYDSEITYDGGRLQYTTNNGNTWQTLGSVGDPLGTNWYTHSGINGAPAFSGSSAGWVYSSFNLAQFNNYPVPVQFRFNFFSNVSNNANGWAIDDFEIYQNQIAQDAGVTAILTPVAQAVTGSSQIVEVTIKNFGTDTLTTIPVRYRINNGVPVAEQWTGNLAPGATSNYTFSTPVVQTANYTLCAWTRIPADTYTQNDTTCTDIEIIPAQYDAAVTEIINPVTHTLIGSPITVSVRLKNFGTEPLTTFDVSYDINSGMPVVETWTGTLAPNAEIVFDFTLTYNSPGGNYILCAKTNLTNDQNPTNDKVCKTVTGATSIDENNLNVLFLGQNVPNPASGNTVIAYTLPAKGIFKFEVVNILGQSVFAKEGENTAGKHLIEVDADILPDGVYYYTISFGDERLTRKMVVSK